MNSEGASQAAEEIVAKGGAAIASTVDVTDRSQVRAMIQQAVAEFGELNVIFNNAGMNRPKGFLDVDQENFETIVRVNAWGVFVCMQEAAKQLITQGNGGKIINTGSIASRQGYWDFAPYCVAKFGVLALTQAAARGLAGYGITVNAFAPGVVETPMWEGLDRDIQAIHPELEARPRETFAQATLIGRAAFPEDLVPFLVYLASPESDYMTGQMYMLDGGMVLV